MECGLSREAPPPPLQWTPVPPISIPAHILQLCCQPFELLLGFIHSGPTDNVQEAVCWFW